MLKKIFSSIILMSLLIHPSVLAKTIYTNSSQSNNSLYAATPVEPSPEVKTKIDALNASNDEDKLVASTATMILKNGYRIFNINKVYVDSKGNPITDVDIETAKVLVEVTVAEKDKLAQITKYVTNTTVNPSKKGVILYAPNYKATAQKDIEAVGAFVARNPNELFAKISEIGAK
jgi:CDP-glycerol glycerophosphotransferase (TagB/SpsB family)